MNFPGPKSLMDYRHSLSYEEFPTIVYEHKDPFHRLGFFVAEEKHVNACVYY